MYFFFFKQKTAYEMRISDWSSDVCSSDLVALARLQTQWDERLAEIGAEGDEDFDPNSDDVLIAIHHDMAKLGTVERHYSDEAKQNARLLIVVKRDGTVEDRKSTRLNSSH